MGSSVRTCTALLLGLASLIGAPASATAEEDTQDPRVHDLYGSALAIDGDQLLVGAAGDNDRAFNGGAVYLYTRSGDEHELTRKLFPVDLAGQEWSGRVLALDGDSLLVGGFGDDLNDPETAPSRRRAAIFRRSGGGWVHEATLAHDDPTVLADEFGRAVAIAGDRAAVGVGRVQIGDAYAPPRVDLFDRDGGSWEHRARLLPDPEAFEIDALALVGDHLLVQTRGVQAYALLDDVWVEEALPAQVLEAPTHGLLTLPGETLRAAIAHDESLLILRHEGTWLLEDTLPLPARVYSSHAPLAFAEDQITAICRSSYPAESTLIATFREENGAWLVVGEPLDLGEVYMRSPTIAADREQLYVGTPYALVDGSDLAHGTVQVFKATQQGWSFDQVLQPEPDPQAAVRGCTIAPASTPRGALFALLLLLPALARRRRKIQR